MQVAKYIKKLRKNTNPFPKNIYISSGAILNIMVFMEKSMFGWLNVVKVLLELFLSSFACFFPIPIIGPVEKKRKVLLSHNRLASDWRQPIA